MEELFEVTKDDIRLNGTELISKEISLLKKVGSNDSIEEEEKAEVSETISKLNGSDFLKLLKENEAKAEKRNQELMRMIVEEELKSPSRHVKRKTSRKRFHWKIFINLLNGICMKNKMIITQLIACILVQQTRAQGNGLAGIQEATQMITSYFDPATKLIYAIGAVVGLIGGVKVYNKFSSGDRTHQRLRHHGSVHVSS